MRLWLLGLLVVNSALFGAALDVVIPCAPKDRSSLELCIAGIRKCGKDIGRIFVVSSEKLTDQAEWVDEKKYPFTKQQISDCLFSGHPKKAAKRRHRMGWIYQQLLKLYAWKVLPDCAPNLLVLDADTIFLQPVEFLDGEGRALYNPGAESHAPYFAHAERLVPGWKKVYPEHSGISHHMLFQKPLLEALFHHVEAHHHQPFWKAFLRCFDLKEIGDSGASEYEIYFNFALQHSPQVKIRPLSWKEIHSLAEIESARQAGYAYVSCHVRG